MNDQSAPAGTEFGPVIAGLSAYMADVPDRKVPEEVAEKGKHHLLDTIGAMVSGAVLKPGRLAVAYVRAQGGTAEASVPGSDVTTNWEGGPLTSGTLAFMAALRGRGEKLIHNPKPSAAEGPYRVVELRRAREGEG